MDGVQLPQGYSRIEEAVYFLPLSSQKSLALILSISEGWTAESALEPPIVFNRWPQDWESSALTTRSRIGLKKLQAFGLSLLNIIRLIRVFGFYVFILTASA